MAEHHHKEHTEARDRGHRHLREAGYAAGGDVKKVVTRAIREHETQEHGGKHSHLKLAKGGHIKGHKAKEHPGRQRRAAGGSINEEDDKLSRLGDRKTPESTRDLNERARGGKMGGHGKPGIGKVNIVIAHGGQPGGEEGAMPPHPPMAPPPMTAPPHPPMMPPPGGGAMPPPGGMPSGGAPPMAPRPMMPPPGAGPGGPPMMPHSAGGMIKHDLMRGRDGRFTGGAI